MKLVPVVPVENVCTGCVDALKPLSDEIPAPVDPPVLVIVITLGECDIAIPAPAENVLYSVPVEAFVMPNTEFAVPVVPNPVPPLDNAN